jgi:hypothetical protein
LDFNLLFHDLREASWFLEFLKEWMSVFDRLATIIGKHGVAFEEVRGDWVL